MIVSKKSESASKGTVEGVLELETRRMSVGKWADGEGPKNPWSHQEQGRRTCRGPNQTQLGGLWLLFERGGIRTECLGWE